MHNKQHSKFEINSEAERNKGAEKDHFDTIDEKMPAENTLNPENQETIKESVNTVKELLDRWAAEYESTDDYNLQRELAYRILRMQMALSSAKLNAKNVKVREYQAGVWGFYQPASGEIAITPEGLELPTEHYQDVLFHESAHAGKVTGRRIMDEGMAEQLTLQRIPDAMKGIYREERRSVKETFSKEGMGEALKKYDFDNPTKLATMYLEVEVEDRWNKLQAKWNGKKSKGTTEQDKFLEKLFRNSGPDIEKQFKKGVPDLYHKLEERGFSFHKAELEILRHLSSGK